MVNIELKAKHTKWMVAKLSLVLHPNLFRRMKSFYPYFLSSIDDPVHFFCLYTKPLPNGKVKDMEGKVVDLSTLTNGKVTLVSFGLPGVGLVKRTGYLQSIVS